MFRRKQIGPQTKEEMEQSKKAIQELKDWLDDMLGSR